MRTILPINPSVRVSEAYVETWARIINAPYAAVLKHPVKRYLSIVRFSLLVESMFSVIQASRILSFMNISCADVINKTSVVTRPCIGKDKCVRVLHPNYCFYVQSIWFCVVMGTITLTGYNSTTVRTVSTTLSL